LRQFAATIDWHLGIILTELDFVCASFCFFVQAARGTKKNVLQVRPKS
jgi:hypothetical protein